MIAGGPIWLLVRRGCWIAIWAVVGYAAGIIGVRFGTRLAQELLTGVTMPAWFAHHLGVMGELARGLLPYISGSVVLCLGLGAHLPGTRLPKAATTTHS